VLRGARREQGSLRVELPEAAAGHPGQHEPLRSGQAYKIPFQRRISARAASSALDPLREARRAADRRNRQIRRGV